MECTVGQEGHLLCGRVPSSHPSSHPSLLGRTSHSQQFILESVSECSEMAAFIHRTPHCPCSQLLSFCSTWHRNSQIQKVTSLKSCCPVTACCSRADGKEVRRAQGEASSACGGLCCARGLPARGRAADGRASRGSPVRAGGSTEGAGEGSELQATAASGEGEGGRCCQGQRAECCPGLYGEGRGEGDARAGGGQTRPLRIACSPAGRHCSYEALRRGGLTVVPVLQENQKHSVIYCSILGEPV